MPLELIAPQPQQKETRISIENGQRYSYQSQKRKCSKKCKTCQEKGGHGPYWYKYWRQGGRVRSQYMGKDLPTDIEFLTLADLVSEEPLSTQRSTAKIPCRAFLPA